jgi:hypothetical protein
MNTKEARDLLNAAKAKKQKKKDDYEKLTEPEKQIIRDEQVAKAVEIIDRNIKDAVNNGDSHIVVWKHDKLIADMDEQAIAQLFKVYEDAGQGNDEFVCTDNDSHIHIELVETI